MTILIYGNRRGLLIMMQSILDSIIDIKIIKSFTIINNFFSIKIIIIHIMVIRMDLSLNHYYS